MSARPSPWGGWTPCPRCCRAASRVFSVLCERPIASVGDAVSRLGVSLPTATRGIEAPATLGIVSEITGRRRSRLYAYDEYLDPDARAGRLTAARAFPCRDPCLRPQVSVKTAVTTAVTNPGSESACDASKPGRRCRGDWPEGHGRFTIGLSGSGSRVPGPLFHPRQRDLERQPDRDIKVGRGGLSPRAPTKPNSWLRRSGMHLRPGPRWPSWRPKCRRARHRRDQLGGATNPDGRRLALAENPRG